MGINGARQSARDLVALTVVLYRWHRSFLEALAAEQGCTLSALLRDLLDEAIGPPVEEEAEPLAQSEHCHSGIEEQIGRSVSLQPRHLCVLNALADRRAMALSDLLGQIVDAWLQANTEAGD
jgi:hypothetical protein